MSAADAGRSPAESGDDLFVDDDDGDFDDGFFDELDEGGLAAVGEFFSEERLKELVGTEDVETVTFLEVRINSEEIVMRDLGLRLPNLSELKLNNSNIASMRDLGTSFKNLTVLWLARSNVQDLDGVGALLSITELYLAFNEVKDLSALVGCDTLEVLDLEGNVISDIDEVRFLSSCEKLRELTLDGNPIANAETYRDDVCESLPQIEMLDDIGRDEKMRTCDEDEAGSPVTGGKGFTLNVTVEDDAAENAVGSDGDEEVRPRTAAKLSPSKKTEKDVEELMLVHKGIKHARTGFDDVDFVSLQDCAEEVVDIRPGSAMRKAGSSGSLRPGSSAGSASRGAAASPAESIESIESAESGRAVYRPGSSGSGGQQRPGTATSGGSGRRPTTASMSVKQGVGGGRPGTASGRPGTTSSMRPRTAALGFGARSGTGGGGRPGTATGSRPSTAGGDHAWAFRRSARSSKSGIEEDNHGGEVASDLTYGAEEVYCGNLARGLRRRNVTHAAEKFSGKDDVFSELSCDEILAELRRWKAETVMLALTPDDEAPPVEYKEGEVMGTGGGDRLILDEEDEGNDEIRWGVEVGGGTGAGILGGMSPPEVEDDEDDDAEELLRRLQERNERSWSRLGAAADAMDADLSSNSDTESQAPTARSSTASSVRSRALAAHKAAGAPSDGAASSPLGSPSSKLSERYRRPTVAVRAEGGQKASASAEAPEFGTSGSAAAPPPRRPTPTIRAPTVRRRPAEGADAGIASGAENAAPSGADNKFRIARARTGSSALAGDVNALATGGTFGVPAPAGGTVGAGAPFGGANSLLAKARGPLGGPGARSPMVNSPIRASSPRVSEGGATFAVPTPPRDDSARPASGARRAPIRPMAIPTSAE